MTSLTAPQTSTNAASSTSSNALTIKKSNSNASDQQSVAITIHPSTASTISQARPTDAFISPLPNSAASSLSSSSNAQSTDPSTMSLGLLPGQMPQSSIAPPKSRASLLNQQLYNESSSNLNETGNTKPAASNLPSLKGISETPLTVNTSGSRNTTPAANLPVVPAQNQNQQPNRSKNFTFAEASRFYGEQVERYKRIHLQQNYFRCDGNQLNIDNLDEDFEGALRKVVQSVHINMGTNPLSRELAQDLRTYKIEEASRSAKHILDFCLAITAFTNVPLNYLMNSTNNGVELGGYISASIIAFFGYILCKYFSDTVSDNAQKSRDDIRLLVAKQKKEFQKFGEHILEWWARSTPLSGATFNYDEGHMAQAGITPEKFMRRQVLNQLMLTNIVPTLLVYFGIDLEKEFEDVLLPEEVIQAWQTIKENSKTNFLDNYFEESLKSLKFSQVDIDDMLLYPRDALRTILNDVKRIVFGAPYKSQPDNIAQGKLDLERKNWEKWVEVQLRSQGQVIPANYRPIRTSPYAHQRMQSVISNPPTSNIDLGHARHISIMSNVSVDNQPHLSTPSAKAHSLALDAARPSASVNVASGQTSARLRAFSSGRENREQETSSLRSQQAKKALEANVLEHKDEISLHRQVPSNTPALTLESQATSNAPASARSPVPAKEDTNFLSVNSKPFATIREADFGSALGRTMRRSNINPTSLSSLMNSDFFDSNAATNETGKSPAGNWVNARSSTSANTLPNLSTPGQPDRSADSKRDTNIAQASTIDPKSKEQHTDTSSDSGFDISPLHSPKSTNASSTNALPFKSPGPSPKLTAQTPLIAHPNGTIAPSSSDLDSEPALPLTRKSTDPTKSSHHHHLPNPLPRQSLLPPLLNLPPLPLDSSNAAASPQPSVVLNNPSQRPRSSSAGSSRTSTTVTISRNVKPFLEPNS